MNDSCVSVKLAFDEYEGAANEEPPIIFCHGLSTSKEHWKTIPREVADATKRKVYAIDARNHGDTEWSDVFTFEVNVDDLLHFMDTVEAQQATIVGHSMGGVTAFRTALRAPDRVTGIFVEDMAISRLPQEALDKINDCFGLLESGLDQIPAEMEEEEARKKINDFLIENLFPEGTSELKKESIYCSVPLLKRLEDGRLAWKCNMKLLRKVLTKAYDVQSECSGIYEGPACFIYGTKSNINVAADEVKIKKFFPRAELIPIENATHQIHGCFKERFMDTLLNFLTR